MQFSTTNPSILQRRLIGLALVALLGATGCSGDDEGVSGKQRADASGLLADGAISNQDGMGLGDGTADDGATSDAGTSDDAATAGDGSAATDAGSTDAGSTDAGPAAKVPCTNNTVCKGDEFCALYYNGVKKFEGEGTPLKLPGWSNVCEPDGQNKAQEGEFCDPISGDSDTILKACVNSSTCMQGTCTALCEKDSQCPTGTRCGASEYGQKLPKAGGGEAVAWLPIDLCVPMPDAGSACVKNGDCSGGKVCRPWVHNKDAALTSTGLCVTPEAGKQAVGGACGVKSAATGLGKLCDSTLCLYEYGGTQTGVCSATCDAAADCPKTLTWNGTSFPTACTALLANHNGSESALDDVYIPHCVAVNEKSPLTNCAATRACPGSQACRAFPIARGADSAAKVEYLCVELTTKTQPKGPVLEDGAPCDAFAADMACKGGYCQIDAGGKGYCSRLCKDNAGCGGGTTCAADFALIPRKDAKNAAVTGMCLK